jgi:hypothetical protein
MECHDIREKLSAYVEGLVSSEEKLLIEEHLKVCQHCSESLADLKETLEYVQNLEEVEPPPWLTGKVMATVRSEAEQKRGILQRLFYPLHVKVPIEAFAAIFLVITTVYIYKTMQPEMKLVKAPSEEVRLRELSEEAEKEIPAVKYAEPSKTPVRVARPEAAMPSAGAVAKDEARRKALPPESKLALVKEKREAISLTVKVKEIETAGRKIEKAFAQLGGRITKRDYLKKKNVIVAELDSKKVNELFEKLELIGKIEEKPSIPGTWEGDIEIRIEISKRP